MKTLRRLGQIVAGKIVVYVCRFIFFSSRKHFHFVDPGTNPYSKTRSESFIYSVWHDSLMMPVFLGRHRNTSAIVSKNFDGGYVAEVLKGSRIGSIRGSSSKGGAAAVRQVLALEEDHHVVVTPDGPRGPAREMKSGVVFLAAKTGRPIVPTAFIVKRNLEFAGKWTTLSIPLPFTTIHAYTGAPLRIPAKISSEDLNFYTERLQEAMDQLNEEAQKQVNRPMHPLLVREANPAAEQPVEHQQAAA